MVTPQNNNNDATQPDSSDKIPSSAWKTLAILSSIATMVMYAETMLVPAIPDLIKDFAISYSISSWILTTYLIVGAVMTPIIGKLSDIYGRKRMLLIIMVIYAAGVSAGGFTTDIYSMLVVRGVQGIGMSMFPIAFGIIRDQFPRGKLAIGQGIISSMFAAGAVLGLLIGAGIIQHYGWQSTFFSIVPIAISLLVIIMKFIHVSEPHLQKEESMRTAVNNKPDKGIDIKGALTLATAVTSFLLALTYIETGSSVGSLTIIVSVFVSIISLLLFIIIERRTASPLVDFRLMLHKIILPANIMIMIVGLSMFMVFQTIPVLVRSPEPLGFGEDALTTAHVQLPFALILLIFGPTSGFIISKFGSLKPTIAGSVISTIGFYSLAMFHSTDFFVAANLAIISIGLSLTNVGVMNVIMLSTPKQFSGISLGMTSLIRIIGASIGPALAGMYMQMHQTSLAGITGSFPAAESYNLIFLTAALVSMASIALAVVLKKRVQQTAVPNV